MPNHSEFYERLQHVAYLKKIVQSDVVDGLGKDSGTVSKWWTGKITPGPKNTAALSRFLGCRYKWLKDGSGDPFEDNASNTSTSATVTGTNNTTIQTNRHSGDLITGHRAPALAQGKMVQLSEQEAELVELIREYMSPAERRALLEELREKAERYR